jgi:hypothetical protein
MSRERLIEELVGGLAPVRRLPRGPWLAAGWLAFAALLAATATLLLGPLRPGAWADLASSPRFALEALAGLGTALAAAFAALALARPRAAAWRLVGPPLAALAAWVALVGYGLVDPSLAPSTLGKRPYCIVEALAYAALPLLLGLAVARRLAPLERAWCGALLALAAAALPALVMHFACTVEPAHVLRFHLAPVVALALLGAALGRLALPKL